MRTALNILRSLRPLQWTKNAFVFAALLFSRNLFASELLLRTAVTFALFCAVSGAVYLMNDILDRERDRLHPLKAARPIASGALGVGPAALVAVLLAAGALAGAWFLDGAVLAALAAYLAVQALYSTFVKHIVILDAFALASGFVIRVAAGALAIHVQMSSWLLVCATLLALFLSLCKRRHELTTLAANAVQHRRVLADYSPYLLDQMIAITSAATVVTYGLYTVSEQTIQKFGTSNLIFTLPFVIYGIFRYLFLVHHREAGGKPERTLVTDPPLLIGILLWALTAGWILYR